jgi:hypothetical protein
MVSPHSPQVNKELEQYKKLYSEFLGLLIELHNYHTTFLSFKKIRNNPGGLLRRHMRRMRSIQYEMIRLSKLAEETQHIISPAPLGRPPGEKKPKPVKKNVDVPGSNSKRTSQ